MTVNSSPYAIPVYEKFGFTATAPEQTADLAGSNLVFLIDVSGSMASNDKLPLLQDAFAVLTNQLGKIYPNVKWNLTVVAHAATFSTANRDGIIAAFTDDGRILLTQRIMP